MNTFGKNLRVTTFGESHGVALGAVIDGVPAGLELSTEDFQRDLTRRKPGQSAMATPRNEKDQVEILSGIFEGKTIGTPITCVVRNQDQQSKDYDWLRTTFRPGHADEVWHGKYGHRDHRGGGRSSGRETIGRVLGGSIAKSILTKAFNTQIFAHVSSLGGIDADPENFSSEEIENNLVRCGDAQAAKKNDNSRNGCKKKLRITGRRNNDLYKKPS